MKQQRTGTLRICPFSTFRFSVYYKKRNQRWLCWIVKRLVQEQGLCAPYRNVSIKVVLVRSVSLIVRHNNVYFLRVLHETSLFWHLIVMFHSCYSIIFFLVSQAFSDKTILKILFAIEILNVLRNVRSNHD